MKRKLYLVLIFALLPAIASALGLGRLDLKSALNEPFEGRIELLSPTADELDSLNVGLADSNAFARAKIDRPFILSKLKFALSRSVDDGPDYIRVFSSEPIREPFLNFLVEVSWSKGRLYREYTVLLDPPLYDPNVRANEFKQQAGVSSSVSAAPVATIEDPDHAVVYSDDFSNYDDTPVKSRTSTSSTPRINYGGGDYGPTVTNDTLWSIASAMRPDSSVSVNQMMLALLRANPDAFINSNINGLRRGEILRMPNESEINTLNNAQALSEAKSQHAVWSDIKESISGVVDERPELSSVPETTTEPGEDSAGTSPDMVETDPELKLVAAEDTEEVTEQAASVDAGGGQDLILAQETIQALTQENIELKDQLQESEAILDDLKRLLSLKDDELTALQEQLAAAKMAEEEAAAEAAMAEETAAAEAAMAEEKAAAEAAMAEEKAAAEAAMAEEAEEVMEEEAMEEEAEAVMEEDIEVIETEPESDSAGIMDMVTPYLAQAKDILMSVKDKVMGNLIVALAVIGVLIVLIIIIVVMKFRKGSAEVMHIDMPTEEAFPDFDADDLGDLGGADDEPDSEAVTVLPGSEDETAAAPGGEANEEEKTQFITPDTTPTPAATEAEEEEDDEDPLQEVNTYLAFEQFDQAEELVRNAINDDPDNAEYHTKLLEVFYTSGNKKAYEEEAKVLHDKVGGEGEDWNMATAMWQEMSPNRALFEAGDDDDDSAAETTGGGFVDVTADTEASDESGGLDFDIGGAEPASDEPLNITGAEENENDEMLDVSSASTGSDDLLDVTAATSLDDSDEGLPEVSADDEVLDVPESSSADSDEMFDVSGVGGDDLLDVTAATSADDAVTDDDEMLDISSTGGEDLLDVTAAANIELDTEEDLLDVTAATGVGADSEDMLDIQADEPSSEEPEESETVEFDVGGSEEPDEEDNILDFDMGDSESSDSSVDDEISLDMDLPSETEDDGAIEMDLSEADDEISLDMDLPSETEDDGASFDLDMGDSESSDTSADDEISLDMGGDSESSDISADDEISLDMGDISADVGDGGIELDLSEVDDVSADDSADLDMDLEASAEEASGADELDFDIGMDSDDAAADEAEISLDMDETVEIPKGSLDAAVAADDDDDDDDDHTVFVPRSSEPEQQSDEDEIATKLDLAKAYVELGDTDSAKTILDEVIAEGNDEQKNQAEELLAQT